MLGLPKIAPSTGVNTSATSSEADRVSSRVIGRYFMNSPTTPGQNSSGTNTASGVRVEEITGHAMRLLASA